MVSSLDGYIGKEDEDVSWMHSEEHYEQGTKLSPDAIEEYLRSIDCYVMGSNTYHQALKLGWPYGEKPVIVLTSKELEDPRETVTSYCGDLKTLINENKHYKNIWVVGGSYVVKDFINQKLADNIVISIMPVILGQGKPFFQDIRAQHKLQLINETSYKDGMIELTYKVKKLI